MLLVCLVYPPPIRQVLVNPTLIKYGMNIVSDVKKIQKYMNINSASCLELSLLAKTVNKQAWIRFDPRSHFHTGLALDSLCQAYLGYKVFKPDSLMELDPTRGERLYRSRCKAGSAF